MSKKCIAHASRLPPGPKQSDLRARHPVRGEAGSRRDEASSPEPACYAPPPMSEKKYAGGCHCGKVRYEVTLDLSEQAVTCNCSMCGRSGTMLRFVPADRFELLSGEGSLTSYRFNTQVIDHLFCSTCGIKSFATGKGAGGAETRAVNVRCLDDVELATIPTQHFDGKSR